MPTITTANLRGIHCNDCRNRTRGNNHNSRRNNRDETICVTASVIAPIGVTAGSTHDLKLQTLGRKKRERKLLSKVKVYATLHFTIR